MKNHSKYTYKTVNQLITESYRRVREDEENKKYPIDVYTIEVVQIDEYGDAEALDTMEYAYTYHKLDDAIEDAKQAYIDYADNGKKIEVYVIGGEKEYESGDIWGDPEIWFTVKDGKLLDLCGKAVGSINYNESYADNSFNADIPYDQMSEDAKKIIDRDSHHLDDFLGSIDEDEQFINKNRCLTFSFVEDGAVGQSNILALFNEFEKANIPADDYGPFSYGGWSGRGMCFWYNPKNLQLVELIADAEKRLKDYILLDEDLFYSIEDYNLQNFWNEMTDEEKREFCTEQKIAVQIDNMPEKLRDCSSPEIYSNALSDEELKKFASENPYFNIPTTYFD